jgi:rod shape-determining protein MreD
MLFDGQLTQILSGNMLMVTSCLFLIFLIYSTLQHSYPYMIIVALVLGLIYDSYYIGVYGIASLIFPLIVLFVYNIRRIVFANRLTRIFTVIIIVTAFELCSGLLVLGFQISTFNFWNYIIYEMAPSLCLNIFFAGVLQIPLERFYGVTKTKKTLRATKKL